MRVWSWPGINWETYLETLLAMSFTCKENDLFFKEIIYIQEKNQLINFHFVL